MDSCQRRGKASCILRGSHVHCLWIVIPRKRSTIVTFSAEQRLRVGSTVAFVFMGILFLWYDLHCGLYVLRSAKWFGCRSTSENMLRKTRYQFKIIITDHHCPPELVCCNQSAICKVPQGLPLMPKMYFFYGDILVFNTITVELHYFLTVLPFMNSICVRLENARACHTNKPPNLAHAVTVKLVYIEHGYNESCLTSNFSKIPLELSSILHFIYQAALSILWNIQNFPALGNRVFSFICHFWRQSDFSWVSYMSGSIWQVDVPLKILEEHDRFDR